MLAASYRLQVPVDATGELLLTGIARNQNSHHELCGGATAPHDSQRSVRVRQGSEVLVRRHLGDERATEDVVPVDRSLLRTSSLSVRLPG